MNKKSLKQDRIKQLEKENEVLRDLVKLQKNIVEFVLKCERYDIFYDVKYSIKL